MPSDHDNLANHLALQRLRLSKSTNAPTPEQMATRSSEAAVVANRSLKLLAFLESSTKHEIETLDLSNSDLSEEDYVIICVVIENHPTVRRLILEGNRLNEVSLQSIIQACRKNRFLAEIRVDSRQMKLDGMEALKNQLESNRIFIKQARRRQWLHLEKVTYDASVQAFCDYMESFFLQEMKLRHHVEEQELVQRNQIGELSHEHRRREIFRQRMKRIIEAVHERLLWVIQREAKFRAVIASEWMSHNILLCLSAEVSHREAEILTEKRVRIEQKTEGTKEWVQSRRMEKRRLEEEALARLHVVEEEAQMRDLIFADGLDYYERLAPVEAKRREDAQMAEFMRIERERREAIQKRKEAEQQRERREKEEKERQAKLLRFRAEQRKEREKFELDATVGRKRLMLLRSTFNRFMETFLGNFFRAIALRDEAVRRHRDLEHLLGGDPVASILVTHQAQDAIPESPFFYAHNGDSCNPNSDATNSSPQHAHVQAVVQLNSAEWRDSVAVATSSLANTVKALRLLLGTDFKSIASFSTEAAHRPSIDGIGIGLSSPTSLVTDCSISHFGPEPGRDDEDKAALFESLEDEQKTAYLNVKSSLRSLVYRKCRTADEVFALWIPLKEARLSASFAGNAAKDESDAFAALVRSISANDSACWVTRTDVSYSSQRSDDGQEDSIFSIEVSSVPQHEAAPSPSSENAVPVQDEPELTLDDVQVALQELCNTAIQAAKMYHSAGTINFCCTLTRSENEGKVECTGSWLVHS